MNYIGEHLLPGQVGHFFAVLSLVASLIATISYFKANRLTVPSEKESWLRFARGAFLVETISVFAIFITLYLYYLQPLLRIFLCMGPYIAFAAIAIFVSEFLGGPGGQFYVVELLALCAWLDIYMAHQKMGSACNDGDKLCAILYRHDAHWYLYYAIHKGWQQSFYIVPAPDA